MKKFQVIAAFPDVDPAKRNPSLYARTEVMDFEKRDWAFEYAAQSLENGARRITIQPIEVQ